MRGRLIAIGDIHGCSQALETILDAVKPWAQDTIIPLGDYIDRGLDTAGALEQLIHLSKHCRLVPLLGNHDEMLLRILSGHQYLLHDWLTFGGEATLASYGCRVPEQLPVSHIEFLRQCSSWYETEGHFFVHACYDPRRKLKHQAPEILRWQSLREKLPGPHRSGKVAIVGHTAQKNGRVLDLGYLRCIDTWAYGEGYLTALDILNGRIWQADRQGHLCSVSPDD
jgi:serine/threonine protein phosphatase 1